VRTDDSERAESPVDVFRLLVREAVLALDDVPINRYLPRTYEL